MSTDASAPVPISVLAGNKEAVLKFNPYCANGEKNNVNPPCNKALEFTVTVKSYGLTSNKTAYELSTDPYVFKPDTSKLACYYNTTIACDGSLPSSRCYCYLVVSPLPQFTQLKASVASTVIGTGNISTVGESSPFVLTDTATASFLSKLYKIPEGLKVSYKSNQSVAEFYGEFYSNSDLYKFFELSGLPNATIPAVNVYGSLPNDQSNPGGEAQLDVEYIMALAPGADTFFYSMEELNPYDPINEGFLAYLYVVGNQTNPPLVHSLSYGDVEANVFNASNPGSIEYGQRCDEEFMAMGLRGLSVLFSSGDDGVGGSDVRTDKDYACSQAWPAWPAASPYVTAVGGTQITDKYLPVCEKLYDYYPYLPVQNQLSFQCSGVAETVCSSVSIYPPLLKNKYNLSSYPFHTSTSIFQPLQIIGGVITSGGGFSDVSPQQPWQSSVVNKYLALPGATPPASHFNSLGRGYPDVATYASNYFVYLGGEIVRESGTSASAPVMAAMVTLWNDIRLAYGLPPLGFLNPFLYGIYEQHPEAFNDIVTGDNACGAGHGLDEVNCCDYSFAAKPGWDATTGLGSPNFDVIANLVINMDATFPALSSSSNIGQTSSSSSDDDSEANDISYAAIAVAVIALVLSMWTFFVSRSRNELSAPLLGARV
jgi:tripeptidyl-peptidase-1